MATKPKRKKIRPTARDLAIFAHVGMRQIASFDAIKARFWPHAKAQTCRDRLLALVGGGYLFRTETTARGSVEEIYYIGRKARSLFADEIKQELIMGKPALVEISHALKFGDIIDRLGERISGFTHEHHLKSERAKTNAVKRVADGRVTLAHSGKTILIEVDGAYYGKRLVAKIQDLAALEEKVLWVTYSARRLAAIQRLTAHTATIYPILFSQL